MLLFGNDELIRACTANYVTDAICRRENLDRYDDRLMVTTNLIEAYDLLMDFIAKHTSDKFFLIKDQSVSVRSIISREIIGNTLAHREFTSAYPAKIIIELDRIVVENWCLPRTPGRIDPDNFTPYPRNPLIANFFINIGRADVLGSGVRNLYQYTKIYSGGEPELIDGDVFRTIVPLSLSNVLMSDNSTIDGEMSDKMSDNVSDNDNMSDNANDNAHRQAIYSYLAEHGEINTATATMLLSRSSATARRVLSQLVNDGALVAVGANKNRVYKLMK